MKSIVKRNAPFNMLRDFYENDYSAIDPWFESAGTFVPKTDIIEDEERYLVRAELPGLNREDVHVEVDHGYLTISGEHTETKEENHENYLRRERSWGKFNRSFRLGSGIDDEHIDAKFHEGLLEVAIPKTSSKKGRTVDVN